MKIQGQYGVLCASNFIFDYNWTLVIAARVLILIFSNYLIQLSSWKIMQIEQGVIHLGPSEIGIIL